MAEKITIAELDIDTDALVAKATTTRKAIQDLKDAQKILAIQGKKNSDAYTKNEVALKGLTTSYNQQKKVLTSLVDENKQFVKTQVAINVSVNKNIKTIEQARNNNKELLGIRNRLNVSTKEGQKQLERINKKLNENNAFIKDNVSAYEKQKIGIGDYEGAIRRVFPAGGQLIDTLKSIKSGLVAQTTATKGTTAATGGASKALKLFKIALISTGIGAIVVALGSLIAAFQSTQKGADAISKALAPIKGAFQGIVGVVQDLAVNIFQQLGDRFTIVKNGMLLGIDLIRLGWNKLTGDTEEAAEIQEKMQERIMEVREAQERLNKKTAELVTIWNGAGEKIQKAIEAQKQMEALSISIEEAENRLIVSRSKSNKIIKANNKIAEDTNKTLAERESAAKRAIAESEKLLKAEQDIIDMQIKQTELRNSQNDTSRADEKELAELRAKRNEKETQALELQTTLTNKLNIIRTQVANKEKKIADDKAAKVKEQEDKQLQQITNFEQRKRDLLNQIELENAATDQEKAQIKAEQDFLKEQEALANLEITAAQREELEALLTTRHEQVKLDIIQSFADKKVELLFKANQKIIADEKKSAVTREKIAAVLEGALIGLLGDTLGAKLSAIAIEAAIQAGLVKITAASSSAKVAANTASAISGAVAASPLTGGFPFTVPIIASGAKSQASITASSAAAISQILGASALKAFGTLTTAKFEKGGLQQIGGKRHSAGGTKFVGEDGTRFEAERGELIGVMSRQASEKFMEFNNAYTPSQALVSSMSVGKFEGGGLISPGASSVDMASAIADRINDVKIVAIVEEITDKQDIQTQIISGADI